LYTKHSIETFAKYRHSVVMDIWILVTCMTSVVYVTERATRARNCLEHSMKEKPKVGQYVCMI
jgi:hypothetical protein